MPTIYGALGLADSDRVFNSTVGQSVVYQYTAEYVAKYRMAQEAATRVFVQGTTENHALRFRLPGSGYMQRRGTDAQPGAVKHSGAWDVGFPLEDFGDAISANDVVLAYMTAAELQMHIDTIINRDANTRRFELIKALVNNTARTFVDETLPLSTPSVTVQPLANGDSVTYPPVLGSQAAATDNHYLESGYAASAISDTNNPFVTVADELQEHFGTPMGGSNIVAFINNAQTAKARALAEFVPVDVMGISYGTNADRITAVPSQLMGASWQVIGKDTASGVWIAEWRYLPANYLVAVDLDAPAPLMERVDPASTGLGRGLQLVATDEEFPFKTSFWRDRFGYGVANRLNGVVLEFGTGGTYTIPSGYS